MTQNSNVAPGGPGIKSSEFLAFLVAVGLVMFDAAVATVPAEYIYGIFGIASAFGAGRTFLKSRPNAGAWSPVRGQGPVVVYRECPPPAPPDQILGEGEVPTTRRPSNE